MPTNFPGDLDDWPDLTAGRKLNTETGGQIKHGNLHKNHQDAIEAIEVKLGKDGSADTNSVDYKLTQTQPLDAELTAIAGLTSAADKLPYFTGSGTADVTTLSAFVRTVLDDVDAPTLRATIGAGTSSFNGTFGALTGTPTTLSGYGITDGQPLDATLTAFAALTIAANSLTVGTGADAFSQTTFAANTFPARSSSGNLVAKTISDFALTILDDADAAAVRSTIGAGTGSGDMLLGTTQTNTAAKTFNDQTLKFRNPGDTFSYTIVASAITADRSFTLPLTTQTETIAVVPQKAAKHNQNPTGTNNTGGLMMGLNVTITPRVTGNLLVFISGRGENSIGDDGFSVGIRYGTGSPPTNGAALTGTLSGAMVSCDVVASSSTTAIPRLSFARHAYITGLTVGTQYWVDLVLAAVTAGTATATAVDIFAFEL